MLIRAARGTHKYRTQLATPRRDTGYKRTSPPKPFHWNLRIHVYSAYHSVQHIERSSYSWKAFIKPLSMICRLVETLISSSDQKIGSNARCPYLFHFLSCNACMQASWQEQRQHQLISKRKVYIKSSRQVSIHSFIKRQAIMTAPGSPVH